MRYVTNQTRQHIITSSVFGSGFIFCPQLFSGYRIIKLGFYYKSRQPRTVQRNLCAHSFKSFFIFGGCILFRSLLGLYYSFLLLSPSTHSYVSVLIFFSFEASYCLPMKRKYSPVDGPHGPKHVVSEWKEIIIKNFGIDGHYNAVRVYISRKFIV
jgi:hypothetical protein